MAEQGPYEILPYSEIEDLKRQINELKKKTSSSEEVLVTIKHISDTFERLLKLFEAASESMKKEGDSPLEKKLDTLMDQNETIAESLLNLIDMVKEMKNTEKEDDKILKEIKPKIEQSVPKPNFSPRPSFNFPSQGNIPGNPPMPGMPPQRQDFQNMPPQPPGKPPMPDQEFNPIPEPLKDKGNKKEKKPLFNIKFK